VDSCYLKLIPLAAPFVHKKLFELNREYTGCFWIAVMNPAGKLSAFEFYIFPNIKMAAEEIEGMEIVYESIDDSSKPVPVERSGTHIDLRIGFWI
jgi:hypothetical protein